MGTAQFYLVGARFPLGFPRKGRLLKFCLRERLGNLIGGLACVSLGMFLGLHGDNPRIHFAWGLALTFLGVKTGLEPDTDSER